MEMIGCLLAALVGVSLGLIGGGGSILMVPILVYAMGVDPVLATSYSLFIVGITSLVGAYNNFRSGCVSIKTALLFGASSITTVFVTRRFIMPQIPPVLFNTGKFILTQSMATMVLFAVLMLFAATAMIREKEDAGDLKNDTAPKDSATAKLLLLGVLIGFATGFLGAGGGFLLIPALVLILKMPMKKAIGTSLLIIALNSLIGFSADTGHFDIDWKFLIIISVITVTGIFIGGFLAKRLEADRLKKAFGWFVLFMGIYILITEAAAIF
jgi:uncharacterized protein